MERRRKHTDSIGTGSIISSTGIGGGGPPHFALTRPRAQSSASIGMGAAGPEYVGRFARRTYTGADDESEFESIGIGGGGKVGSQSVARL